MSKCKCHICVRWDRWLNALKPETDEAKAVMDEIFSSLESAETDSVYWRMKYDGTWNVPDAVTIPIKVEEFTSKHCQHDLKQPNCTITVTQHVDEAWAICSQCRAVWHNVAGGLI